jgi:hypothetical protein
MQLDGTVIPDKYSRKQAVSIHAGLRRIKLTTPRFKVVNNFTQSTTAIRTRSV